ncbi:tripartite tricarboxylate transporter substrate binding protein [Polynucleobacter sp. AP-Jannik-300A-C4]|uniref:Bug family tripartite tricarboxylate transporter substrate binding protein n=1 Tax=Polynucleobacter sp. AP-Jannik-300A-C4 TaxID=2576928 RepID=UPI001BFD1962|nr:tripartite tricarboxylate transporter substrate binding protein [Polynucleobacter sp. AP-Jannik-300A-C4]QWE22635.1 tripartite tricarboxylate transporter substrate binding protein [Polynucleobacter sp. AP-Jannik-300A-C4]
MKKILMFLMCVIAVASGVANAQEWPNRSIKFISPFAPGGSNDIATRLIAEKLSTKLQQTIIVENKPGANIRIASEIIARAEPDGYNFVMVAAPHTTNPALYGQLPYDTLKDFTPVVQVVRAPLFLMVPANSPIKTVAELLAASAKQPTGLNISSPGNGTAPHLALELFNNLAKSNLNHIPYKGDAPAVTDLLGERVDAGIHPIISPLPHVKSGKIRVLAVFGSTRSSLLPDVPSLGELGYKNTEVYTWFGLVGPAKLPVKIVDRLNKDVNEILSQPEVRQRFADMGMETVGGTSDQFAKFIRDDIQKWKTLVAQRNIKPD